MNRTTYSLISKESENGKAFGLNAAKEGIVILSIEDISPDELFVSGIIDLFNREQLDPIHVFDVLEDMLP
jgi:hypothetical protein